MKMKNIFLSTLALAISFATFAQEEEAEPSPTFSVAGSIDTYFRSSEAAPGTSFANLPGFAMGMANIILSYEGEKSGFTSIPRSIYWAIVTLTTVGYGDISPQTNLGQGIAAMIMILGYSIIAVPTGIVTSAMHFAEDRRLMRCSVCEDKYQKKGSKFCNNCGAKFLNDDE